MGLGDAVVRRTNQPPQLKEMGGVLSHVCTGMAVITGHDGCHPIGFLPGPLAAVSVHPAYVSFRPSRSAAIWPLIRATGRMCINILAAGQESVGARFTRRSGNSFADIDWSPAANGTPRLHHCAATIEADLEFEHGTGDDMLVMAYVTAAQAHGRTVLRPPQGLQSTFTTHSALLDPAS
ncbi:flavin reductase family protein [Mycobacteroides abscessus]|uniref:Flavin reductase n=2 Tax=Mycobacteroides abscessus TaxID=36809 RepID=A0ABD7HPK2_9MYCO|nr:flavin reductase family protein [Mycobacteroides abscessus]AWG62988.1 flavin reductase [Mycobacteroides abscessus]PVA29587.1 flavin reductase [Mycobacteroides abscessus]PVA43494.1 flavin reductase [Mycobacteroides abscessus]PVA73552.1 flavin reductase [Mycobacteroides abscessus]PVB12107.1 flavin reductase [Mycobacteroides abscessus]